MSDAGHLFAVKLLDSFINPLLGRGTNILTKELAEELKL